MFGEKKILSIEKLLVIIAIMAVFLFAYNFFNEWANPLKDYFFMAGKWEELAIIFIFVFGIGYVLQYLAKLALRLESSPKPRRRAR